ncbi:MAG: Stp1/IreP family PP2C-type Ser/Thr phosphatase [Anaerovoracaceae bacterium]
MLVGFKSDKGMKRFNNEDACFVLLNDKVYVVADGVGGNNSGEIASRTAVNEIANYITNNSVKQLGTDDEIKLYFDDCVRKTNATILKMASKYEENNGMATTLVVVFVKDNIAYITNIGDSRAYLYRNKELIQITEDHTYVNTLIKAGIISEEEAETHENKNMITKAVGADYDIEPDFFKVEIRVDDILLICTDGLYGELEQDEIGQVLDEEESMSDACARLVAQANINGGHDNITIVCLKVTEDDINE